MKKFALALAIAALFAAAPAFAASANSNAAQNQSLTSQQNRMKECAAQYHAKKIEKSKYRAFMSECLKDKSTSAAATAAQSSGQATVGKGLDSYRAKALGTAGSTSSTTTTTTSTTTK